MDLVLGWVFDWVLGWLKSLTWSWYKSWGLGLWWYLEACPDVGLGLVLGSGLGLCLGMDGWHLKGNNVNVSHFELFVWGKKFLTKTLYRSRILYVFSLK